MTSDCEGPGGSRMGEEGEEGPEEFSRQLFNKARTPDVQTSFESLACPLPQDSVFFLPLHNELGAENPATGHSGVTERREEELVICPKPELQAKPLQFRNIPSGP